MKMRNPVAYDLKIYTKKLFQKNVILKIKLQYNSIYSIYVT